MNQYWMRTSQTVDRIHKYLSIVNVTTNCTISISLEHKSVHLFFDVQIDKQSIKSVNGLLSMKRNVDKVTYHLRALSKGCLIFLFQNNFIPLSNIFMKSGQGWLRFPWIILQNVRFPFWITKNYVDVLNFSYLVNTKMFIYPNTWGSSQISMILLKRLGPKLTYNVVIFFYSIRCSLHFVWI